MNGCIATDRIEVAIIRFRFFSSGHFLGPSLRSWNLTRQHIASIFGDLKGLDMDKSSFEFGWMMWYEGRAFLRYVDFLNIL